MSIPIGIPAPAIPSSPFVDPLSEALRSQDDQFLHDLTRLRADALIMLGWITGAISYLWLIFLIWPVTGTGVHAVSWVGALTMLVVSSLAILGSHHIQRTARYGFAIGLQITAGCAMVALNNPAGAYLFLLPVIFASVLF